LGCRGLKFTGVPGCGGLDGKEEALTVSFFILSRSGLLFCLVANCNDCDLCLPP
jgi:hypothetical protein